MIFRAVYQNQTNPGKTTVLFETNCNTWEKTLNKTIEKAKVWADKYPGKFQLIELQDYKDFWRMTIE